MNDEHPDAKIIALGIEYDRYASDCDRLVEHEEPNLKKLRREEDRLFREGRRLLREILRHMAKTPEGLTVQKRMLDHCNRWAGTSSADRARGAESAADALVWQMAAALPAILGQLVAPPHAKRRPTAELAQ